VLLPGARTAGRTGIIGQEFAEHRVAQHGLAIPVEQAYADRQVFDQRGEAVGRFAALDDFLLERDVACA